MIDPFAMTSNIHAHPRDIEFGPSAGVLLAEVQKQAPAILPHHLLRNSICTVLARCASISFLVISVPIIVACLGTEGYGVWESLMAIAAMATVFQLVLNGTVLWRISTCYGQSDFEEAQRLVRIGVSATMVLTLLFAPLTWWIREPLISGLRVTEPWVAEATWMLPSVVGLMLLGGVNQILLAVVAGCQRSGLAAIVQSLGAIATYLASIGALMLGGTLDALFWGYLIGFFVSFLMIYPVASHLCGSISLIPLWPSRREVIALGPFAGLLLLSNLTLIFRDNTDKLVLAALVSSTTTGYFGMAHRLSTVVHQVCAVVTTPFTAAVGSLHARNDWPAIRALYSTAAEWMGAFAGLLTVLVCTLRTPLFIFWLGEDQPQAHGFLALLLLGATTAIISAGPGVALAKGIGLPGLETAYTLVTLGLIFITKPLMVAGLGPTGVVVSSALSWCAGALVFLALLYRRVSLPRTVALRTLGILAVTLVASTLGWWAAARLLLVAEGRAAALAILLCTGLPLAGLYLAVLAKLRLIQVPPLNSWLRRDSMREVVNNEIRSDAHASAYVDAAA